MSRIQSMRRSGNRDRFRGATGVAATALGSLAVLLVAAVLAWPAAAGDGGPAARPTRAARGEPTAGARSFQFESLNRSYSMAGADIAPIQQGPITVYLSSPRNVLIVRKNRLVLEPVGDGTYRSWVSIDLLGSGDLIARFDTGTGAGSPMEDRVVLPPQTIDLAGRVRFQRVPSGWEVTALSLPDETEVTIQSRVFTTLVNACEQLSAFLGLDCGGLQGSLTRVAVPLPEPGSVFLLEESDLTPADVRILDGFLGTEPVADPAAEPAVNRGAGIP